ncbi:MAG: bifunctional riboflavin kinase/FAD synthetase [Ignavibacteria bacterium]|nr:bifunctional riboflavin kinase/FAD synthetase [Ignavibacteria bacterium]
MIVYRSIEEVQKNSNTIVTVGTFDGVHLGHREIIQTVLTQARQQGGRGLVVTFHPHPRMVLHPDGDLKLLQTINEKLQKLGEIGVEEVLVIPFTKEFANLTSEQFFTDVMVNRIGLTEIIIGYDHRFGKSRTGDEQTLQRLSTEFGFTYRKLLPVTLDGIGISSSKIRQAVLQGDVATANIMLGSRYTMTGKVETGNMRGRTIGFPTANVTVSEPYKLLPANGVYAVQAAVKGITYDAVMNIGFRPTYDDQKVLFCEAHLFDFSEMIYGEEMTITFYERLREEKKFSGSEELIAQIQSDAREAKALLQKLKNN